MPDPRAAARMAAFDALPAPVRVFLVDCPFDFSALLARRVVDEHGTAGALSIMRMSVAKESRRYAVERQHALDWAREAFCLGPRPKHVPPPGGWTVHNFPG